MSKLKIYLYLQGSTTTYLNFEYLNLHQGRATGPLPNANVIVLSFPPSIMQSGKICTTYYNGAGNEVGWPLSCSPLTLTPPYPFFLSFLPLLPLMTPIMSLIIVGISLALISLNSQISFILPQLIFTTRDQTVRARIPSPYTG